MKYAERTYRDFAGADRWTSFRVKIETTDLYIRASCDLSVPAEAKVRELRNDLRKHIERHDRFMSSLNPLPEPTGAPPVASLMYRAARAAGVGPMAAVAGAMAELVGRHILPQSEEVVVENGGDIWLAVINPVSISVISENIYFRSGIALVVRPECTPCGVCTSSATTGPSLSFGRADAMTVIARDAALADALATASCNMVRVEADLAPAVDFAIDNGALGALGIYKDTMAARGAIELLDPRLAVNGACA